MEEAFANKRQTDKVVEGVIMNCPPATPGPCQQVCPPPPPPPPCRVKPIMRGLHMSQIKRNICQGLVLAATVGAMLFTFVGMPRKAAYKDFYAKAELEDWADEMAKKGLFQSVPKGSLADNKK